jgi:hypothetical protein
LEIGLPVLRGLVEDLRAGGAGRERPGPGAGCGWGTCWAAVLQVDEPLVLLLLPHEDDARDSTLVLRFTPEWVATSPPPPLPLLLPMLPLAELS